MGQNKGAEREGEAMGTRVKHLMNQQPLAKKQERGDAPGQESLKRSSVGVLITHTTPGLSGRWRLRQVGTVPVRPPEAR